MEDFIWKKVFSVEVELFDKQHQKLFTLGKKLYDSVLDSSSKKILNDIINELCQYTNYHFQDEEYYMEKYNIPNRDIHIKEHQYFRETITKFSYDIKDGKIFMPVKIINFLQEWSLNHIFKMDKQYSKYLKDKKIHSKSIGVGNAVDCD